MNRLLALLLIPVLLTGCASFTEDPLLRFSDVAMPPDGSLGVVPSSAAAVSDVPAETVEYPALDPYTGLEITFLAVGDNLIHPNIYTDARKRGTAEKEFDFLPMYAGVADRIREADFAFINQETLMAGESYGYSGYPTFNSPQQLGMDLVTLGFDIIGLANNHMLDLGSAGLADSVRFWDSQPVVKLGATFTPGPVVLEKDGVTIGLLGYTYGTNGYQPSKDALVPVPYLKEERILADMEVLAECEPDIIIASVHWGVDSSSVVTEEQHTMAQFLADAGVDVILGHHSHCLQPIVWLTGAGGKQTLCAYSLGNIVSGMNSPKNHVSGLFTFSIVSDGTGGVKIADPLLIPTVFYFGMGWYNTQLYLLEDYTDAIAAGHGIATKGHSLYPAQAREIVTDMIDPQFLPEWMQ